MRKVLFVHHEQCLPGAIQDVNDLLKIERQRSTGDAITDLLAILVMPEEAANRLLFKQDPFQTIYATDENHLFAPDTVSRNGVWTLATLSHPHILRSPRRDDALRQFLDLLQAQEGTCAPQAVLSVNTLEGGELLAGTPLRAVDCTSS